MALTRLNNNAYGETISVAKGGTGVTSEGLIGNLVKLSSGDFTTQASVTVDNVFTADYSKYKILLHTSNPTNYADVKINFRDSTPSDMSFTQYGVYTNQQASTTTNNFTFRSVSTSAVHLTNYNTSALYRAGSFDIDLSNIYAPLAMDNTNYNNYECFMQWTVIGRRESGSDQFQSRMWQNLHQGVGTNYSIRGVKFYVDAGTITGTYAIYGYKE